MVILGLLSLTAAFAAVPAVDMSWRMRAALNVSVVTLGFLALWPTFNGMSHGRFPCPAYIKDHVTFGIEAGLDLRGGLRLVYTVDVEEAVKDKRDHYYEDMRVELTRVFGLHQGDERPTEEMYTQLREKVELEAPRRPSELLRLRIKPGADPSKIDERFLEHFRSELSYTRSQDGRDWEFRIRSSVESSIRDRAVGQAREIINRRIDELGLREAAVSTRDEDIIVEVPGEDEKAFSTIRDIISQTARLEFKLLDDDSDFFKKLRESASPASLPEGLDFASEQVAVGLDKGGDVKTSVVTYALLKKSDKETIQQSYQRMKEWIATLEVPPDREVGLEVVRRTVDQVLAQGRGQRVAHLPLEDARGSDRRHGARRHRPARPGPGRARRLARGADVHRAGRPRVRAHHRRQHQASLRDHPRRQDRERPRDSVAHRRRPRAEQRSARTIRKLSCATPRKLELVLRSGALPAPISPSNEQRIGPSLGRDAIDLGVQGALGGSALVLLFMIVYYNRAGLIADIAVIMNLFLQLAVLASFGASMTLPGIAGLALTIGMSVDANVLIYERIREELDLGKSPRAAVEIGYKRAFSAIFDGHITSVIAGVVLAQYGTGPIKGFAATLLVGVVCSLFTGVAMTRVMFDLWVRFLGRQGKLALG